MYVCWYVPSNQCMLLYWYMILDPMFVYMSSHLIHVCVCVNMWNPIHCMFCWYMTPHPINIITFTITFITNIFIIAQSSIRFMTCNCTILVFSLELVHTSPFHKCIYITKSLTSLYHANRNSTIPQPYNIGRGFPLWYESYAQKES